MEFLVFIYLEMMEESQTLTP